ncbi:CARDB domain-containing protein [Halobium salinum]|uniref:CARDB domain-containing protein n=1 Tax=Halobium salinum TaxID=1364940 RepID=A0ABD5PGY5_9EURY|nr:CARDB domain-containing protein [Halobium salinum]
MLPERAPPARTTLLALALLAVVGAPLSVPVTAATSADATGSADGDRTLRLDRAATDTNGTSGTTTHRPNTDAEDDASEPGTDHPNATTTPRSNETTTATPRSTPTPTTATASPTLTPTRTPASTGDPSFVVSNLSAPRDLRVGDAVTVTATVTNAGDGGTERVNYSFGGATVDSTTLTLAAGESTDVRFRATTAELADAVGDDGLEVRTYVHGVRNGSGAGVARRLRVTPDVDFTVDGLDAPTDISRDEPFVVLATVGNPGASTITRQVTYRFDSQVVAERAVTVAPGEQRQVAFEVGVDEIEAVVGDVRDETTYYHAVGTTGGDRRGGSVRVVRGPSADAETLAVEGFEATDDVREGDTVTVNVTLRNVAATDFEGQLSYRLDDSVVATEWARVPSGERRTVRFRVSYADVERAAVPLSAQDTSHGVWVGDDAVRTRPVTVHAPTATATTPTPAATFSPTPDAGDSADAADADGGAVGADDPDTCSRGLLTKCGGTPLDETTLTVLGTFASVFGIVHQLTRGD